MRVCGHVVFFVCYWYDGFASNPSQIIKIKTIIPLTNNRRQGARTRTHTDTAYTHSILKLYKPNWHEAGWSFTQRMRRNSDAEETNKNMLICEKIHQIYWIQSWSVAAGVITCLCACQCARAVLFQINGGVNLWESMIMHAALPAFNHGLLHPSASVHIHLWPPLCLQYIGGILRILFQMYVDESRTSSSWSKKATLLCKITQWHWQPK